MAKETLIATQRLSNKGESIISCAVSWVLGRCGMKYDDGNHSLSRVRVFMVKRNSNCNAKVKAIKESQLNHVYWDLGR